MKFREIEKFDVPQLFNVRVATRENTLSRQELEDLGINEISVTNMLATNHKGWLCEVDNKVIGFAMGNRDNGELSVIAVLPGFEGKGVGAGLLNRAENWLWSNGWNEIWLTTDVNATLRAYGFYKQQGWEDDKIEKGMRFMKKQKTRKDS